jgi:hypothetical protein
MGTVKEFVQGIISNPSRRRLLELGVAISGASLFLVIGVSEPGRKFFESLYARRVGEVDVRLVSPTPPKFEVSVYQKLPYPHLSGVRESERLCRLMTERELFITFERMKQLPYAQLQKLSSEPIIKPSADLMCRYTQSDFFADLARMTIRWAS